MRNLVYIAYTFPPVSTGSAPMNLKLARLFISNGWLPNVVTPGVPGGLPLDPTLDDLLPSQVRVVRTGPPGRSPAAAPPGPDRPRTGIRWKVRSRLRRFVLDTLLQPDRHVTWLPAAVAASVREVLRSRSEVIISLGPPHSVHLAGMVCCMLTGRPWIAYFGDLWANDGYIDWASLPPVRVYWTEKLEGLVVRGADGIITTTDGSSDYFRKTYGASCPPVATLWNGLTREEVAGGWNREAVPPLDDELVITYTGFFMGNQSPEYVLKGMKLFREIHPDRRLKLRIVGELGAYAGLPAEMGMEDSVEVIGKVPFSQVRDWQRRSHLLLIMLPPQPGNELKNAAKTAEYLLARRPILAVAAEGDMTGLIRRLGAGYSSGHDPAAICSILEEAYDELAGGNCRVLADPSALDGVMDMETGGMEMVRFLEETALV